MAVQRRIGYWLVELDRLINERFEEDLAAGGLGRGRWQILHSLSDGPQSASDLRDALDAFLTDPAEWAAELAAVLAGGLVVEESGTLSLTDAGRATHDQAWARIGARRREMTEGITDAQFAETMWVLEKMAANMAGAEAVR
ncbi:MarR family winged helix-turn-helix transcriptional regulator [Nocardia iowensis]|uniref:MarR family transcriptional regulator n=1 Tax=Nocardia iowensis TaxID=204891 RepID=A0ABX8RIW0_NOCIO|nr:MarR family transcriptional regulator [Nocardia iowensis]QXN89568.1 MarR family transcriptional regulator [Nocardia iowensis]